MSPMNTLTSNIDNHTRCILVPSATDRGICSMFMDGVPTHDSIAHGDELNALRTSSNCERYCKVCNFERDYALRVESAQNVLKFFPQLDKFITSLNMQSILCTYTFHDI